jgi:hypothetical protein
MSTIFEKIAADERVRPATRVGQLLETIRAFDNSASMMLLGIERDLVRAVEAGAAETVALLHAERDSHRRTQEIMLADAQEALYRLDARIVLADVLAASR